MDDSFEHGYDAGFNDGLVIAMNIIKNMPKNKAIDTLQAALNAMMVDD